MKKGPRTSTGHTDTRGLSSFSAEPQPQSTAAPPEFRSLVPRTRASTLVPDPGAPRNWRTLVMIVAGAGSDVLESTQNYLFAYAKTRFRIGVAQAVNLAVYELFANALSYGTISKDLSIELLEDGQRIGLRTVNVTIPARIEMLTNHVARIKADPQATYVEEMNRTVTGARTKPMLGLARLANEAGFVLDVTVDGSQVTVTASCRA